VRIERVRLVNFLSHRDSVLEFDPHVNVIIGENGSGKSSILEAIYYALYGDALRGSIPSLFRREGTRTLSRLRVSLEFEAGGRRYSVHREASLVGRSAKTTECRLEDLGSRRILAEGPTAVKQEIVRLVGVDDKTFRSSVFVPQGEIGRILEEGPSERRRLFMELIGISDLDKLHDILKSLEKNFRKRVEDLKIFYNKMMEVKESIEELEREKKDSEVRLMDLKEKLKGVSATISEIAPKLDEARVAQSQLKIKGERLKELEEEIRRKEGEIASLREELRDLETLERMVESEEGLDEKVKLVQEIIEVESKIDEFRSTRRRLEELRDEMASLERQISDLEHVEGEYDSHRRELYNITAQANQLERELHDLSREIRELEGKLSGLPDGDPQAVSQRLRLLREDLDRTREKWGVEAGRRRMLEEELKLLRTAKGVCPTCGRPLEEGKRLELIAKKEREIERMASELETLERAIREKEREYRELEELYEKLRLRSEILDRLADLRTRLKETEAKLEGLKLSRAELEKRIGELERSLKIYREKLEKLRMIQGELRVLSAGRPLKEVFEVFDTGELEKRRDILIKEYLRRFGELPVFSPELLEGLQRELESLRQARIRLAELKGKKERLELLEKDVEGLRQSADRIRRDIRDLEKKVENLEVLEKRYSELEDERDRMVRETSSLESTVVRIGRELDILKKDLAEYERKVREMERLQRAVGLVSQIRELLRIGIKQRYNERVLAYLKGRMPRLLSDLGLDFVGVELDGDLNLRLSTSQGSTMTYRELSGGEKVLVSLAFRLALLHILGASDSGGIREPLPLILDEPTTHLDDEHRGMVIEALRRYYYRILDEAVPQMIIVSHYPEFKNVANRIFTVSKKEGISSVFQSSAQQ